MDDNIKTYKNPQTNNWFVDLEQDRNMRKYVPATLFNLTNNSDLIANIYLNGTYMGEAQAYSPFSVSGKGYETFTVSSADGQQFNEFELIVQVSKVTSISQLPYNPQVDLLEDNLDRYASGCDGRISIGSGVTLDAIIHWINAQNSLIVQRRVEISGSGSMGTYDISFGSSDDLSGGVGQYSVTTIEKRVKKTINDYGFGYSTSNCGISGWIIDFKKNLSDISDNYTLITGSAAEAAKMIDDDMSTYGSFDNQSSSYVTEYEVNFSARSIISIHLGLRIRNTLVSGCITYYQIQIYNGSWITIGNGNHNSNNWVDRSCMSSTGWNNISKIRIQLRTTCTAQHAQMQVYDLSVF